MSATDPNAVYALELLQTFSFLHFDAIGEQIFESAKRNTWNYMEGSIFSASATNRMMPSGWDQLVFAKALQVLLDFSLITIDGYRQIFMHPLVHEWSRERMSLEERVHAWEIAISTMAMSIYCCYRSENYMYRRMLKPHVAACLATPESKERLFADGLHVAERYSVVDKLAMVYEDADQNEIALDLHKKNLRLKRLILPSDHIVVIDTLRRMALALRDMRRCKEAIEIHEKLLDDWQAKDDYASDTFKIYLLEDLADTCLAAGYYEKALGMLEEVIRDYIQIFGASTEMTLLAKSSKARCLYWLDRDEEAAQIQEAVLVGIESIYSRAHPATLMIMDSLANIYWALGKKREARKLREETLVAKKSILGEHHPKTFACQANILEESRWMERGKGLEACRDALQKSQKILGARHVATIKNMSVLAERYLEEGYLQKAKDLQEEVVRNMITVFGEDNPHTVVEKRTLVILKRAVSVRKFFYWWLPRRILDNR